MNSQDATTPLRAGAAAEVVTPEPGRGMGGYASRVGPAEGVLDDLYCRIVVLSHGTTTLVVIAFDLIYVPARLSALVTAEVARALATTPEHVLVTATHTHCGPAIAGPGSDALIRGLADAALRGATNAAAAQTDVDLIATEFSVDGLAHYRREPPAEIDETGRVLVAVSRASGEPVASVVTVACHPTVLEGDTVAYSRDYPGALCDTVEAVYGGVAVFLQGFAGDANPAFHDHSPADMRSFGRLLGARAAAAVLAARRSGREQWTVNLSRGTTEPVSVPASWPAGEVVEPIALSGRLLHVPVEAKAAPPRDDAATALAEARRALAATTETGTPAQLHAAAALEAQWWIEDLILDDPPYLGIDLPPEGTSTLPVQILTLGQGLRIVAFPGEPLHGAAEALRAACGAGLILVGYAHRAASYLPCRDDFAHGGYEIGSTRYQSGTVERLVAAVAEAVGAAAAEPGATTSGGPP